MMPAMELSVSISIILADARGVVRLLPIMQGLYGTRIRRWINE
jgi:hypothetical protein